MSIFSPYFKLGQDNASELLKKISTNAGDILSFGVRMKLGGHMSAYLVVGKNNAQLLFENRTL